MDKAAAGSAAGEVRGALEHSPAPAGTPADPDSYSERIKRQREDLEREFPDWQIWTVDRWLLGLLWIGRPPGTDYRSNVEGGTAEELARNIRAFKAAGDAP